MKFFLSLNVNNCSKGEYYNGYKEFSSDEELTEYLFSKKLDELKKSIEVDENIKIKVVSLYLAEFNVVKDIVDDFDSKIPSEINKLWEKQFEKQCFNKKNEGFINWTIHLPYVERIGKLKNLLTEYVNEYLKKKLVFGYLGHELRKSYHDEALEHEILKINSVVFNEKEYNKYELLGVWLTSNDARHFMDKHGEKSYEEFSKSVEESMEDMLITALIFSDESHTGTLKSTIKLRESINEKTVCVNKF